ncbi:hypothetical protein AB0C08_24440, partial [Microbispora bryophytorum]|uniref:hypothetical protein n=1 Tax=Microbispora bryophytorum TaxID=1460882 RepID=UPI0033EDD5C6
MSRITQVAVGGALLFGALGCTASAKTVSADPTMTLTPALPTPLVSVSRQDVRVEVDPKRIVGGSTKSIHITARCPLPQGGTEYRATARSDAFTGLVTLVAPPPPSAPTPHGTRCQPQELQVHGTSKRIHKQLEIYAFYREKDD